MRDYIRRYLSIILVLCMLMSMVPVAYADNQEVQQSAAPASRVADNIENSMLTGTAVSTNEVTPQFSDMPDESRWSHAAMQNAVDHEILRGNSDGQLAPKSPITRAEMATIINRLFGASEQANISAFSDMESGRWYYSEMAKAVQMKTFSGGNDGLLNPTGLITREEAFTVIARAIKLESADDAALSAFSDQATIHSYARKYLSAMVSAGYISGNGGLINPRATITREEVAQVIYNVIGGYVTKANETVTGEQKGNVIISVPGVTVKNATVKGDLIIGDGVGNGEVTIDNTTVSGRVIVRGGGENSIKIVNKSNVGSVIVSKTSSGNVRVLSSDGAKVDIISVDDGANDVKLEGTFLNVSVDSSTPVVLSAAVVTNLEVNAPQASVNVESGTVANTVVSAVAASAELSTGENAKMGTISVPSDAAVKIDGSVAQLTVTAENASTEAKANITLGSTAKVDTIKSQEGANAALNADASATVKNIEAANKNDISIISDSSAMKEKLENAVKETSTPTETKQEETQPTGGGGSNSGGGGGSGSGGGGDPQPPAGPVSMTVSTEAQFIAALANSNCSDITIGASIIVDEDFVAAKPIAIAEGSTLELRGDSDIRTSITNNGTLIITGELTLAKRKTLTNKGSLYQNGIIHIYGNLVNEKNFDCAWDAVINAYTGASISGIEDCTVYTVYENDCYYADGSKKVDQRSVSLPENIYTEVSGSSLIAFAYGEQGLKNAMESERTYSGIRICKDSVSGNNNIVFEEDFSYNRLLVIDEDVLVTVAENCSVILTKDLELNGTLNIAQGGSLSCRGTLYINDGGYLDNSGTLNNNCPIVACCGASGSGLAGKIVYLIYENDYYYADGTTRISEQSFNFAKNVNTVVSGSNLIAYAYGQSGLNNALISEHYYEELYVLEDAESENNSISLTGTRNINANLYLADGVELTIATGARITTNSNLFVGGKLTVATGGVLNCNYNTFVFGTGSLINNGTINDAVPITLYAGAHVSGLSEKHVYTVCDTDYFYSDGTKKLSEWDFDLPEDVLTEVSGANLKAYAYGEEGLSNLLSSGKHYETIILAYDQNNLSANNITINSNISTDSGFVVESGVSLTLNKNAQFNNRLDVYGTLIVPTGVKLTTQNASVFLSNAAKIRNSGTMQLKSTHFSLYGEMTNAGVFVSESPAYWYDGELGVYGTLINNGTFLSKGPVYIDCDSELINNGVIMHSGAASHWNVFGKINSVGTYSCIDEGTPQISVYDGAIIDGIEEEYLCLMNSGTDRFFADGTKDLSDCKAKVNGVDVSVDTPNGIATYVYNLSAYVYGTSGLQNTLSVGREYHEITLTADENEENNTIVYDQQSKWIIPDLYVTEGVTLDMPLGEIEINRGVLRGNITVREQSTFTIKNGEFYLYDQGTLENKGVVRLDNGNIYLCNQSKFDNQNTAENSIQVGESYGIYAYGSSSALGMNNLVVMGGGYWIEYDEDGLPIGNIQTPTITGTTFKPDYYATVRNSAGLLAAIQEQTREYSLICVEDINYLDTNISLPEAMVSASLTDLYVGKNTTLTVRSGQTLTMNALSIYAGKVIVESGGTLQVDRVNLENGGELDNQGTLTVSDQVYMQMGTTAKGMDGIHIYKSNDSVTFSKSQATTYSGYTIEGNAIISGSNETYAYVYGKVGFNKFLQSGAEFDNVYLYASGDSKMEIPATSVAQNYDWDDLHIASGVTLIIGEGNTVTIGYTAVSGILQINAGATFTIGKRHYYSYYSNGRRVRHEQDGTLHINNSATVLNYGTLEATGNLDISAGGSMLNKAGAELIHTGTWSIYGVLTNKGAYTQRELDSKINIYAGAEVAGISNENITTNSNQYDYYMADGTYVPANNKVKINGEEIDAEKKDGLSAYVYGAVGFEKYLEMNQVYNQVTLCADEDSENNTMEMPAGIYANTDNLCVSKGVTLTLQTGANLTVLWASLYGSVVITDGAKLTLDSQHFGIYGYGSLINNGTVLLNYASLYISGHGRFENNGTLQTENDYTIEVSSYGTALNMQGKTVHVNGISDYYDEDGTLTSWSKDHTNVTDAVIIRNNSAQVVGSVGFTAAVSAAGKGYTNYSIEKASKEEKNQITLGQSMTISSLSIAEGVTLTIPENASLTIDSLNVYGELIVAEEAFLTVKENTWISQGTITNNGTFTNEGTLYIHDDSGWDYDTGYYAGNPAVFVNNGKFTSTARIEVTGEDAKITNSEGAYFANYSNLYLYSGATLVNRAPVVAQESGVGFYNVNGHIYLRHAAYGEKNLISSVDSTEPISSEDVGDSSNYVYSEADLRAAIGAGKKEIYAQTGITLSENLTIPSNTHVSFSTLKIPAEVTLRVEGSGWASTLSVLGGTVDVVTTNYFDAHNLNIYSGNVNYYCTNNDATNLRINNSGTLSIESGAALRISGDVVMNGTLVNDGTLTYRPTIDYPEDVNTDWIDGISGTGTIRKELCANTYSTADFYAAQEDADIYKVNFRGNALTISDTQTITKRTEIMAPVTITSSGTLTVQGSTSFHELVAVDGQLIQAAGTDSGFNDMLTVSEGGTLENNGSVLFNNEAVINGKLLGAGEFHVRSNWYYSDGNEIVMISFGTLTLGESAQVALSEQSSIWISRGSYLYQLCPVIVPTTSSYSYALTNEGHFISCAPLTISGRVNNAGSGEIELQDNATVSATGSIYNQASATIQIQGNGGKLTNNGTISNYGQIHIMQGGVLAGKAPANQNNGLVEDSNPSDGIFIIGSNAYTTVSSSGRVCYVYDAIINNAVVSVNVDGIIGQYCDGFYRSYTLNEDGVIIALSTDGNTRHGYDAPIEQSLSGYIHYAEGVSEVAYGVISIGNPAKYYAISDNAEAIYIDEDGEITQIAVEDIAEDGNDRIYALTNQDGAIEKIVVRVVEGTEASQDGGTAIVISTSQQSNLVRVKLLLADGSSKTVTLFGAVAKDYFLYYSNVFSDENRIIDGDIVSCRINADGSYMLAKESGCVTVIEPKSLSQTNKIVTRGNESLDSFAAGLTADSDTVFLIRAGNNKFIAFTGIGGVPSITLSASEWETRYVSYLADEDNCATLVYVDASHNGDQIGEDISYLFVGETTYSACYDPDIGAYYEYTAMIDGEQCLIKVIDKIESVLLTTQFDVDENGVYSIDPAYSIAADTFGEYTAEDKDNLCLVSGAITAYSAIPSVTINGTKYSFTDDAEIYTIVENDLTDSSFEDALSAKIGTEVHALFLLDDLGKVSFAFVWDAES